MARGSNEHSPSRKDVLVVDDDNVFKRCATRLLSCVDGISTRCVSSAQDALALAIGDKPDLVLLDINLGEGQMDGVECAYELRRNGYSGLICMLTGDPCPERMIAAAFAGADSFLSKASIGVLKEEISRLLKWSHGVCGGEVTLDREVAGGFLRSAGVDASGVELLLSYAELGFPSAQDLAKERGISEDAVWKRMSRVRQVLGLSNLAQIGRLLTALSTLGRYANIPEVHSRYRERSC